MPFPNSNRQNYRMRPNYTPPPARNPYLSYQDLQKKAATYKSSISYQTDNFLPVNQPATDAERMNDTPGPRNNSRPFPASDDTRIFRNPVTSDNEPSMDNDFSQPMTSPRQMDSQPMTSPQPMDSQPMTSPQPMDSQQMTSPRQMDSQQMTFPRQMDSQQMTSPRPMDSQQMTSPRPMDSQQMTSPRPMDSQQMTSPRPMDSQQMTSPRQMDSQQMTSPRQMDSQQMTSPRPMDFQQTDSQQVTFPQEMDFQQVDSQQIMRMFPFYNMTEQDYTNINSLFPADIRRILAEIQREFDSVDYKNSFIYDTYPDSATLSRMSYRIYITLLPLTENYDRNTSNENQNTEINRTPGLLPVITSSTWLYYVILILVYHELANRRQRMDGENN